MNKKFKKFLTLSAMVLVLVLAVTACQKPVDKNKTTPLVVGYSEFSEKFSPFFAKTAYDSDAVGMTQVALMVTDRVGGIVYKSIAGEKISYNGKEYTYTGISDIDVVIDEQNNTTTYKIKIRSDIKFSDGHVLDADDIIFSYYVLSDPSYTGSSTLYSLPIIGMKNYRANNSLMESIDIEAGKNAIASRTDLQQAIIDAIIKPTLTDELDWVKSLYTDAALKEKYKSYVDMYENPKDLFAYFYATEEGYDSSAKDEATILADVIAMYGFDYKGLGAAYAGDAAYFVSAVEDAITPILVEDLGQEAQEVPNITGIVKKSQTEVEVTTKGYDATAIYHICGISVAPMHYYGSEAKYDYAQNKFGFDRGDLSGVDSKTTQPMGAGPYKFIKFENKVIYYEANENYYKGAPKIKYVQFKESTNEDKIPGVKTGTLDVSDPSGSKVAFEEIASYNSNGKLTGNVITTSLVDNLGYGYIGISAQNVKVGDDISSAASKNLRKAFATVFSVYREEVVDTYYGEAASVINYPISNTSWAAPQKSDSDYEVAYAKDVDGNPIFTSGMSADEKKAKALEAAVGFLKAAGFTYDESAKKFTAAPTGAKLDYELIIPGGGKGEHPSFMIVKNASDALKTIGITLNINDPTDSNVLWNKLDSGEQEFWVAAWGATIDPDMYQVYHSSNIVGKGGTDSNHYGIESTELDKYIMDARKSADQAFRKLTYKAALDLLLDWGVEIPVYQRQNCIIFNSKSVKVDSITPDITTFYGWMSEIENMELK